MQLTEETFLRHMQSLNSRFDSVDERLECLESRIDKIEMRLDGLETRLDRLETRLDKIESCMDSNFEYVYEKLDSIDLQIKQAFSVIGVNLINIKDNTVRIQKLENYQNISMS